MKSSFKKLTSVFLAVLMLISVVSAAGVSAAETGKAATGGASFKFTDNRGWGSVYVYAWNDDGPVTSAWPGDPGNSPEQNSLGETFFTIDVPDGATGCVVNNGEGAQTTDITDFEAEGYYTDGSKDDLGHFVAIPWPGFLPDDSGGGYGGSGSSFKFTDNQKWGSVYVYAWDGDGNHITSAWPGDPGNDPQINDYGETYFTIDVPDGAVGCVVSNGNGAQTNDITDFNVEGYYTDGTLDDLGHYVVIPWPGGDTNPSESGDPPVGTMTAYLDPGTAGGSEWYAWTWDAGGANPIDFVYGTQEGDLIKFDALCDTVIFMNSSGGASWDARIGQTASEITMENGVFTVDGEMEGDDGFGNPITQYTGSWAPYDDNPSESSSEDDSSEQSDPQESSSSESIPSDPQESTPGQSDPVESTPTAPTPSQSEPTPSQSDAPQESIPTNPSKAADEDANLYISANSNLDTVGTKAKVTGENVTVTYYLATPIAIDGAQGTVYFDSTKLELTASYNTPDTMFGVAKDAQYNLNAAPGEMIFNFSGTNGKYDFTNNGKLVSLVFKKRAGATGTAYVYLKMNDLYSKTVTYIEDGEVKNNSGIGLSQTISAQAASEPQETPVPTAAQANLTIKASSNINKDVQTIKVDKNNVKVTYTLTYPQLIAFGRGFVYFDSEKLALESRFNPKSSLFTTLDNNVVYNLAASTGTMIFTFTSADPLTKLPTYDFRNGGAVVTLMFTVKEGATGEANVHLVLDELGTFDTDIIEEEAVKAAGLVSTVTVTGETPQPQSQESTPSESNPSESTPGDSTPSESSSSESTPDSSSSDVSTPSEPIPDDSTPGSTPAPTQASTPEPTTKKTESTQKATSAGKGATQQAAEKFIKSLKNDKDPKGSTFASLSAKVAKVTKTSAKISWKDIDDATKYVVYGNKCGKNKPYKTMKTTSSASFTKKSLKKGTYYKFLVIAYDENNKVIATSKTIHVATSGGKVTNPKKLTLTNIKKSKLSLKKGKTFKLKTKITKMSKKLTLKNHRAVAFETSKKKVATVSSKGKITAKKKGTCYIYAYAQNGVSAKVKVTVK